MTNKQEIYKCSICGNVVEVIFSGDGELVCCNQPMELMEEKTGGEHKEWHIPVIDKINDEESIVKTGKNPHPMTPEHYIQMIEIYNDNCITRKYLTPDNKPEYIYQNNQTLKKARAYCNLHGLWKNVKNEEEL